MADYFDDSGILTPLISKVSSIEHDPLDVADRAVCELLEMFVDKTISETNVTCEQLSLANEIHLHPKLWNPIAIALVNKHKNVSQKTRIALTCYLYYTCLKHVFSNYYSCISQK